MSEEIRKAVLDALPVLEQMEPPCDGVRWHHGRELRAALSRADAEAAPAPASVEVGREIEDALRECVRAAEDRGADSTGCVEVVRRQRRAVASLRSAIQSRHASPPAPASVEDVALLKEVADGDYLPKCTGPYFGEHECDCLTARIARALLARCAAGKGGGE